MNNLHPLHHQNTKVVTTRQLATWYKITAETINNNFNRYKSNFVEGEDYYKLSGKLIKDFKSANSDYIHNIKFLGIIIVWSQSGVEKHAGLLKTSRVWWL